MERRGAAGRSQSRGGGRRERAGVQVGRAGRRGSQRWTLVDIPVDVQAAGRGSPRLGLWALPQERTWPVTERGRLARQTGPMYYHSKAAGAVQLLPFYR